MEKNNKINLTVFSYTTSILLIYPVIRWCTHYYNMPFYFGFFLSLLSAFIVNHALTVLDLKYNFAIKLLQNSFFQHYLFFFLKMENFLRRKNNAFFFGIIISVLLIISYMVFFDELVLPKHPIGKIVYHVLYYFIMIYIRLRSSLINFELFQTNCNVVYLNFSNPYKKTDSDNLFSATSLSQNVITKSTIKNTDSDNLLAVITSVTHKNNYIKWVDFINFYNIKNKCSTYKNNEFKNITPVDIFYFFSAKHKNLTSDLLKNLKQIFYYIIKVLFGIFSGIFLYIKYRNLVSSIDGQTGIRTKIIYIINSVISALNKEIERKSNNSNLSKDFVLNDLPVLPYFEGKAELEENLKQLRKEINEASLKNTINELSILEDLKQKINNLSLWYFLKNRYKLFRDTQSVSLEEIYSVLSKYNFSDSETFEKLKKMTQSLDLL